MAGETARAASLGAAVLDQVGAREVRSALRVVRPLERLVVAEQRIKGRDFKAEPWLMGEGAKFWTPERVARLAAENEALRLARKARK